MCQGCLSRSVGFTRSKDDHHERTTIMSTAISTHHGLTRPATLVTAAATAVVVAGAAFVGYAISQDDTVAPTVSTTSTDHDGTSQAGTGLHDFTSKAGGHDAPLKGGHTMIGLP